jgi:hypothetical protein
VPPIEPIEAPAAPVVHSAPKRAAAAHGEPSWTHWPLEKKLDALEKCTLTCAKTVRHLRAKDPTAIEPTAVDSCMGQCNER